MLDHNPKLKRIELAYPHFATQSDVERLKNVVRFEMFRTGSSRGIELADEGFIHASTAAQWPATRERFYADVHPLLLLHIDESLLGDTTVVYEQLNGASSLNILGFPSH